MTTTAAAGKVMNDDRADWTEAWVLFPGDVAYVWHGALHTVTVAQSLVAAGFETRSQIVWAKQQLVIGRGDYHWMHEPCWYVVRTGRAGQWNGDRKQATIWNVDKPAKSETGHSTQKPVECMGRPIVNNSKPVDFVHEPSGTTVIAAEMSGLKALCIELSQVYRDVIMRRWQTFASCGARLDGDGRAFEDVAAERLTEVA